MKVAVVQTVASVGKTLVAVDVLYPRMPDCEIITVDKANRSAVYFGIKSNVYTSDEFKDVYRDLVLADNAVLDVGGAKEAGDFLNEMNWGSGHDEIDYFVIVSKPDNKDQEGAVKTIDTLLAQGVGKEKIKVVFTAVVSDASKEFDLLLGALVEKEIPFTFEATIFKNRVYDILAENGRTVKSMLSDQTDYKARIKESNDKREIDDLAGMLYARNSAAKIDENLDTVFHALFPKKAAKPATTAAVKG